MRVSELVLSHDTTPPPKTRAVADTSMPTQSNLPGGAVNQAESKAKTKTKTKSEDTKIETQSKPKGSKTKAKFKSSEDKEKPPCLDTWLAQRPALDPWTPFRIRE